MSPLLTLLAGLAVAAPPAELPKPTRSTLGDVVGVVTKVSDSEISVKFTGVTATPSRSTGGSRGRRGGRGRSRAPQVKYKSVEETVTYRLLPDIIVSRLGTKDKLTTADIQVGEPVRVHVVRETTRVPGSTPDLVLLATKLTLDKMKFISPTPGVKK